MSAPPDLAAIEHLLAPHHLTVLGGFNPASDEPGLHRDCRTLLLLGPRQPGFWPHLTSSAEWRDGAADPVDRWSRRVIGRLACDLGAKAYFPFGGPPYHPFYSWALRTGRIWESPIRLLVHDEQGLWISFRGALALRHHIDLPQAAKPCVQCDAPCTRSCPVEALGPNGYDVPRCHAYLDTGSGQTCLDGGCQARAACPVSARHARMVEQSAYHMRQFHR